MKKAYCLSVLCFVLMLPYCLIAQTAKEKYEKDAIYLKATFWHKGYVKNGEFIKLRKLKNEFIVDSPAKVEFDLYKKIQRKGIVWGITAITMSLTALAVIPPQFPEPEPLELALPLVLSLGAFAPLTLMGINVSKSYNHLQKAVWLHNEEVSFK